MGSSRANHARQSQPHLGALQRPHDEKMSKIDTARHVADLKNLSINADKSLEWTQVRLSLHEDIRSNSGWSFGSRRWKRHKNIVKNFFAVQSISQSFHMLMPPRKVKAHILPLLPAQCQPYRHRQN